MYIYNMRDSQASGLAWMVNPGRRRSIVQVSPRVWAVVVVGWGGGGLGSLSLLSKEET